VAVLMCALRISASETDTAVNGSLLSHQT